MSSSHHHRRSTCRLCESTSLTEVFSLTPTPPANAFIAGDQLDQAQPVYPLDLFFCEECSHLQLLDVVDPAELFRNYVYVSGTSASFVKHFENYAQFSVDRFALSESNLVVDIGSNDGTLLKKFEQKGVNVLGIDPAHAIAEAATKDGIETWPEFFDQKVADRIRKEKGPASLITANNVFAHADDLSGITDSIRSLLTPEGVFMFEVSYLGDVFEKTLFDTIYHEHVAYHSVIPLVNFFSAKGMDFFAAKRIDSHGGSLRGMVQLSGGPHKVDGSITELVDYEKQLKLDKPITWTGYAQKIDALRDELVDLVTGLKNSGKKIAGFGAPAKATTLMYHFDIGPDIIDFIADDSPLKQGLYSPGLHIPVLAGDAIYETQPDYLVLLAWNFAPQIMANHQEYLDGGGHFIVPLPNVRIY
ncbi:MAG: class I SAM-dependent methyltransferase [Rhodospirillaceae bacterium]|nr:class I SAM-dependent methyltransferase [Rhodospirillaceae bacterium]